MLLEADRSLLLLVDAQTRFAPAIHDADACLRRCRLLIEAAKRLDVPVVATEQYPEGLGPTVPELAGLLEPAQVHAKRHFSCAGEPQIVAALEALAREAIVICGMEAHICVLQSALGLKALGFAPIVVADAVGSREPASREVALQRLHGPTASRSSPPRWWSTSGCARPALPPSGRSCPWSARRRAPRPGGHWPG